MLQILPTLVERYWFLDIMDGYCETRLGSKVEVGIADIVDSGLSDIVDIVDILDIAYIVDIVDVLDIVDMCYWLLDIIDIMDRYCETWVGSKVNSGVGDSLIQDYARACSLLLLKIFFNRYYDIFENIIIIGGHVGPGLIAGSCRDKTR